MQLKTLLKLGARYVAHDAVETLYLKTGHDVTKPLSIRGAINERCNYKQEFRESIGTGEPKLSRIFSVNLHVVITEITTPSFATTSAIADAD